MIFPLLAYAIGSTHCMEKTVMDALIVAAENEGTVPPHPTDHPTPTTTPLPFGKNGRETKSPSILAAEDTLMLGVVMVLVVVQGGVHVCGAAVYLIKNNNNKIK